ncbi:MAG: hypothetical protein Q8910_00250 [Bacteroidota bacterium]|nr:hypothetical protein [Bacteroidota bacterium]
MIVYHGSKNQFDQWSYNIIGQNGTSEGIGFYFTDNKTIAEGYASQGYLYTVEFNGKKLLSHDKKTITKQQIKKYLLTLNDKINYLDNYGEVEFEGLNSVLNEAIEAEYNSSDNDVDIVCGICHASGNIETCLTTLHELLGYDSIVLPAEWGNGQTLYIALVNNVIQIQKVERID